MKLICTEAADPRLPVTAEGCGDVAWHYGSTYTFAASITASASSIDVVDVLDDRGPAEPAT